MDEPKSLETPRLHPSSGAQPPNKSSKDPVLTPLLAT